MTNSVNTREIVLDLLMEVTRDKRPSHLVLGQMLAKYQYLEKQERTFISRLFKGTLEMLLRLDHCIGQFSTVKVSKMKPMIRNILRMSVYQILYMDHVPDSAACNEAVKLSGRRGFKNLKGFVNGVLRNVSRNKESLTWPDEKQTPIKFMSVWYSAPDWLVQLWVDTYGLETARTMLEDSLKEHPVTIRCVDEAHVEELVRILEDEGVTVKRGSLLPYALKISGFNYLEDLDSFNRGLFTVQDESSMLVAEMAGLKAGDTVIDVCAAPGGKSLHAAAKLKALERQAAGEGQKTAGRADGGTRGLACNTPPGHVYARDLTEDKVSLIEQNIGRSGLDNVTAQVMDATVLYPDDCRRADVVFADLPCSGLGVIGRKADIKYNMSPEQMKDLTQLQREILSVVCEYVVDGGTLMYSTCTVNPEENVENARWFAENYPFTLVESRQLLPGVHDCDGFFVAKFRRKEA